MTEDADKPTIVNLALLKGGGTADQRAELLRSVEVNWDDDLKFFSVIARIKKRNFDAYLKAGFTQEQALSLVK